MQKPRLTLEQANRVVEVWGVFLEFWNGQLMSVFGATIPESLLPYPRKVIEEAHALLEDYFRNEGRNEVAESVASATDFLMAFKPDEEALSQTAKRFTGEAFLASVKKNIGSFQQTSLEYLLKNY